MNWSRIKTILIYALIAINVLLFYTIYQNKKLEKDVAVIDKKQIFELYNQRNILLPENILDTELSISNLQVKLSSYDMDKVRSVFKTYANDGFTDARTELVGNKLTYTTKYEGLEATYLSDDKVLKTAQTLIGKLGFPLSDIYLEEIGRTGKKTILKYSQIINGSILTDSKMIITFNNNNLIDFQRLWYDIVKIQASDTLLYSPEYALYTFLGLEYDRYPNRKKGFSVQSLKLVYRLDQSLDNTLANPVVEGETVIYWEIKASNDIIPYYINAIRN